MVLGEVTGTFDFVMEHATRQEREILLKVNAHVHPLSTRHKYTEYKVRCKYVEAGEPFMEVSRPHYDVTEDFLRPELPEVHHLWTTPPMPIFYTVSLDMKAIECPVPVSRVLTYGRFSLHQTPVLDQSRTRLLIRATESDIVKPRNIKDGR